MKNYEEMLNNLYATLPKNLTSGERFEIPKLDGFIEGNKTIVKNFLAAVQTIRRTPQEVSKYLSKELAAPSYLEGDRLIFNGKVKTEILNKKFEEYVLNAVICKQCKKPDTHIEDLGHGIRIVVCEACGAKHPLK